MKQKFLKDLEKKLSVLSEEEIKDIIDEYSNIIDEKIKRGKTEEEAVNEFGNINELSKEILKTYKINPDYNKNDFSEKTSDFIKSGEKLIKQSAKKLTDVTEEVIENIKGDKQNLEMEHIFEIIIKVILVLVGLAILKIPFYIILGIGSIPFNGIFNVIWRILVEFSYIAVCILLIVMVVNKYTKKQPIKYSEKQKKETIKSTEKIEKSVKQEESKQPTTDSFTSVMMMILKIWCIVVVLLPLWCTQIGILVAICFAVYLIVKGVAVYGILILLIGVIGMAGYISDIIWRTLFSKKRIYIFPVILHSFLIIIGSFLTLDYVVDFTYIDKIPPTIETTSVSYEKNIDQEISIPTSYEKIIDPTLEDGVIKMEIVYYHYIYDRVTIDIVDIKENGEMVKTIDIVKNYKDHYFWDKKVYQVFLDNLKDQKIYNYRLLNQVNLNMYGNEFTLKLLK